MSASQRHPSANAVGLQSSSPYRQRRRIILCFDGTGNKFSGSSADSNILKIYGMLDRTNGDKHYYQPGIGTYVDTRSISHTSKLARLNSWYQKAKDSAVGTSFDLHVMGAYKFLMQCYEDHDIFFFGFSRGAYVARFLAEMLDNVGLLSAGNEEMVRFAWKAFARWQQREDNTAKEKQEKKKMLEFLLAFRETFSRPVRRIRFLGLFDTVNSVPRFENAWMQRSKFPYTARSSARVIRHAVSIDERRAKFRQDLISEAKTSRPCAEHNKGAHGQKSGEDKNGMTNGSQQSQLTTDRFRRRSQFRSTVDLNKNFSPRLSAVDEGHLDPRKSSHGRPRSVSPNTSGKLASDGMSIKSSTSLDSYQPGQHPDDDDDDDEKDEAAEQDIEEIWFPGCHADLGGGWPLADGEESALSHGPLVWMVREAQRAGLEFDRDRLVQFKCCGENYDTPFPEMASNGPSMPQIQVSQPFASPKSEKQEPGWAAGMEPETVRTSDFHHTLYRAATEGRLHDCLEFNNGLPFGSVVSWKMMEYLPFRRMDLRPDGSWKAISMPLPRGEVRDMPENAWIHHSAIQRMEANENYRPGNLIIGGGGRGVKKAPKALGMGEWEILKGKDDPVGMVYVRKGPSLEKQIDKATHKG